MPRSSVIPLDGDRASLARILVGAADMMSSAAMVQTDASGTYLLESFVGLAQFTPVPDSDILDTSVTQVLALYNMHV